MSDELKLKPSELRLNFTAHFSNFNFTLQTFIVAANPEAFYEMQKVRLFVVNSMQFVFLMRNARFVRALFY
jgi:hypothetical protein